ncbi:MAG TPA: hypothetical protein EYP10_03355 [Armatimonadetes bacterium]|nr:hypothetical protein [Armatimonadota bacterium]
MAGIINIRASEILCAVPCLVVAVWYLIAYYEEQGTGRESGILISSVGWAFVGFAFLCPARYWSMRLISGVVGLMGILIGCVIGLRVLTSLSKSSSAIESEQVSNAEEEREPTSSQTSTEGNVAQGQNAHH